MYRNLIKVKNQNSKDYNSSKIKLRVTLRKIGKQLIKQDSQFYIMTEIFSKSLAQTYSNQIHLINESNIISKVDSLIANVNVFMKILLDSIFKFYNIHHIENQIIHSHFQHLIIECVIRDELYDWIFRLFDIKNTKEKMKLGEKISLFRYKSISELRLKDYFKFDQKFRSNFKKQTLAKRLANLQKKQEHDIYKFQNECIRHSHNFAPLDNKDDPFSVSIYLLKKLKDINSPLQKLKQLRLITLCFENSVKLFWSDYEVSTEKLLLEGEEILTLMIYIIIKSNYTEIVTDSDLIQQFLTSSEKLGKRGFHLITVASAIDFILNCIDETFFDSIKKVNEVFEVEEESTRNQDSKKIEENKFVYQSVPSSSQEKPKILMGERSFIQLKDNSPSLKSAKLHKKKHNIFKTLTAKVNCSLNSGSPEQMKDSLKVLKYSRKKKCLDDFELNVGENTKNDYFADINNNLVLSKETNN